MNPTHLQSGFLVQQRLDDIDRRIDNVDRRIDIVDRKMNDINGKLDLLLELANANHARGGSDNPAPKNRELNNPTPETMFRGSEVAPGPTGAELAQGYNNLDTWQGNAWNLEELHSADACLQVVPNDPSVPSNHQQAPLVFPYDLGFPQVDQVELSSMQRTPPASMVFIDGIWRDPPPAPVQAPIVKFKDETWDNSHQLEPKTPIASGSKGKFNRGEARGQKTGRIKQICERLKISSAGDNLLDLRAIITALKGKIPEGNYSVKRENAIADCIDQLKRRFGPWTERTVELKVLENVLASVNGEPVPHGKLEYNQIAFSLKTEEHAT